MERRVVSRCLLMLRKQKWGDSSPGGLQAITEVKSYEIDARIYSQLLAIRVKSELM